MKTLLLYCIRVGSAARLAKLFSLGLGFAIASTAFAQPAKIVTQPSDVTAPEESAASLKAEVSGEPNTYRWFRSNGGGGALKFNGELQQYVSVPIDVPETEYTVEFWFRTEDPNAGLFCVVDQNLGTGGHDRHIHLINGNIRIRTWSGPGVEVSEGLNLADGKWHHIAHVISMDLGGQYVYVDGELVIEGEKDTSNFDWQKHINIGFSNDAAIQYLNGEMDELRIWDAALEQEEIQERMNQPLEGDEDWLLAYYDFDQAEGDSLVDATENELNGVLINFEEAGWASSTARLGVESAMTNGGGVTGADSPELKFERLAKGDEDTYFLSITNPEGDAESDKVKLTVTAEITPPTVVRATADASFSSVLVTFSEPMDMDATAKSSNFSIAGLDIEEVSEAGKSSVRLATEKMGEGETFILTVKGGKDLVGNSVDGQVTIEFGSYVFSRGFLTYEYFGGIPGVAIEGLLDSEKFDANLPDTVPGFETKAVYLPAFSTFSKFGNIADNYGAKISGYVIPPADGFYEFHIRSDDASQLLVSTDETADNLELIAEELNCCGGFMESGEPETGGPSEEFTAGKRYLVEALYKEGGGGDWFEAAWRHEADAEVIPAASLKPIAGAMIGTFAPPRELIFQDIVEEHEAPLSGSIALIENSEGVLEVPLKVTIQDYILFWERSIDDGAWLPVPSDGTANLALPPLSLGSDYTYRLTLAVAGGELVVANYNVEVTKDEVAPQVVSTGALITEEDTIEVGVQFNELLEPDSAEDAGNYTLKNANVLSATLADGGDRVLLEVEDLDIGGYELTINGVNDLAGNRLSGGKAGGDFLGLQVLNIGDIAPEGVAHNFGEEIEVIAGGFDVWSNADDFTFLFEEKNGDFDMAVQVTEIENAGGSWARNGLMIRKSLEDYSKMLGAFVTPPSGLTNQGYFALERREDSANCFWWNNSGTPGSPVKHGVINYGNDAVPGLPNLWIRMKRSGNKFTAFRSDDGQNWIEMGVNELEFSETVYFGICQSRHAGTSSFVRYQNYGPFVYQGTEITITEPPQSVDATLGWDHTFRVGYTATASGKPIADSELTFQWNRDGQAIEGANGPSYKTPGVLGENDNGAKFSVTISMGDITVTSDEAVLSVVKDTTPPTVAAIQANQPAPVSGGGAALEFKGIGQYVSVPINIPEVNYTVEFWFRTEDPEAGLYAVVDQNLGAGGHDRHLFLSGGNLKVRTWNTEIIETQGLNLADGQWHHVAHTLGRKAKGQQLFVDGKLAAQGAKTSSNFNWQKHINIGFSNDAGSQHLVGAIDEVRIWRIVRTEEEINATMNKPLTGDETRLMAYYTFDETKGNVLPDALGKHDGVLVGMNDRNWALSDAPLGQAPLEGIELPVTVEIQFDDLIRNPHLGSGGSLIFDGQGAHVALPDDIPQIFSDGEAVTIEYWFKGESLQSAVRWQDGQYFVAGWHGQHIISTDGGTANGIAVGPATDGKWHHVAMTWEVDMIDGFKSYLDGELVAKRDSGPDYLPLINTHCYLGSFMGVAEFTKGQLDEVRIWETVRSQEELQEWKNKPLKGDEDGLIAYYQFDEIEGGTLPDLSDNELDGALVNMTDANWAAGANASFTLVGPKGQAEPGTVTIEEGQIESIEYLADGRSIRAVVYGDLGKSIDVEMGGFRDAGDNEMESTQISVQVERDGPAEAPVVTIDQVDGVLIINTTSGTLQSAPSVNGPWENVPTPLQLNSDAMGAAEFFRAVTP